MTVINCDSCNLPIVDGSVNAVECEFCNKWMHATIKCSKITKPVFAYLTKSRDYIWICPKCTQPCRDRLVSFKSTDPSPSWAKDELDRERALAQSLLDQNKDLNIKLNEKEIEIIAIKDRLSKLEIQLKSPQLPQLGQEWTRPNPRKTSRLSIDERVLDTRPIPTSPNTFEMLSDADLPEHDWPRLTPPLKPLRHSSPSKKTSSREKRHGDRRSSTNKNNPQPNLNSTRSNRPILQFSNKNPKLNIVGDSHARNCCDKIQRKVGNSFKVQSLMAPGAPIDCVIKKATEIVKDLDDDDLLVVVGGVNNMSAGSVSSLGNQIDELYASARDKNKNIIWTETPLRFDIVGLNELIREQNEIIRMKCSQYKWTFLNINTVLVRSDYTRQGLHLNNLGKEMLCGIVATYAPLVKKNKKNSSISVIPHVT